MIGTLLQTEFEELIRGKDWESLRAVFEELDPSDIAELLVDIPDDDAGIIFRLLTREQAADVFAHLPLERQEELIHTLSSEQVTSLLDEMTPDDRTRLLEEMPAEVTRRLLETLSPEELRHTRRLLGYPEDSAGRYMTPEYVALRPDMTAGEALEHLRRTGRGKETLNVLYIVDERGKLVEDLRLGSLVLAEPSTRVGEIDDRPLVSIPATADREEVLQAFEKYDRVALPVTDTLGNMLGIITVDDILDVAEEEATEDMQKMGGMEALDEPYTATSVWQMFRKRGVWLSVLFVGQLLTASVIVRFEVSLAEVVALMSFVPLIISSGGNSGSQATSLIIRAMAVREVNLSDWLYVLRRESLVALLLGTWLGLLGLFRVQIWQLLGWYDYSRPGIDSQPGIDPLQIAGIVGISLVGVVIWGSLVGSMLPFILRRIGLDPATSSAPFVATLVDVTGLIVYFSVATLVLRGAML